VEAKGRNPEDDKGAAGETERGAEARAVRPKRE